MLSSAIAIVTICLLFVGMWWIFAPRTLVDTTITFDPASIGPDLDAYLANSESQTPGIRQGQHKQIVWADPSVKQQTPLAIIYLHGFSASPGEVRPLPDMLATNLGANLYFTRFTGHGATPDAMGSMSVNALVNDLAETIAIGERLGERVVIVASSSGAALSSWGLTQPQLRDRVSAAVLMSPNYGVLAFGASLLTIPGARQLAHLLIGNTRSFEPSNALHALYWTTSYPVEALLPMAEIVKLSVNAPIQSATTPTLFLISSEDKVVDPAITRRIAKAWGSPSKLVEVDDVTDPSRHVLAGDAMSPTTTGPLVALIENWLRETLRR